LGVTAAIYVATCASFLETHERHFAILDNSPARVERNSKVIAPGRNMSHASFLEQGRSPNLVLLHSTPVPIENAQIVAAWSTLSAAVASLREE
jgi:hypothetical protein